MHLRWWRSPAKAMTEVLKHAGIPTNILSEIPNIINTCRECRAWQSKPRDTIPSITLATHFNEIVEWDLLFYQHFIVNHEIDRCTRFHASCEVQSKGEDELLDAIATTWMTNHGPPKTFVIDGETSLSQGEKSKQYFQRIGTQLHVRAPNQHARFIERRGAILRHCMHVMEEQLKREGLKYTFKLLLAEATFCGNAMTFVGQGSPYNAVYGRQPAILPDLQYASESGPKGRGDNERIQARICLLYTSPSPRDS